MAPKKISQKKFAKMLNPGTGILSQSPGSLQRVSNLLATQRGSLQTCDGSFTIGTVSASYHLIVAMSYYNNFATGVYPFYPTLSTNAATTMQLFIGYPSTPAPMVQYFLATAGTWTTTPLFPALLPPGDPAFAAAGSSTTNSNPSSTTGSVTASVTTPTMTVTNSINFSGWSSLAIAGGTQVTVTVTFNATSTHGGGVISGLSGVAFDYSVNGGATFVNAVTENNTISNSIPSTTVTFILSGLTNMSSLVVRADARVNRGSATFATETLNVTNMFASVTVASTLSPYGGVSGKASLIPQILQFTDTTILILGNGLPPMTVNVTLLAAATPAALTNTFTANYPNWQPSVAWVNGNQISVVISGTTYLFTAVQGGVSGTSAPAFSAVLGSTVTDNQVIWSNSGAVSTSPAPRGAAHGIVYAGSLWLANTSPQTTSDQNDGPTVLKMSDTNNPQSWNPLNVAFIGRDDGTQITGLASFTIAEAGIAPTGSLCVFKEFTTYQVFGVFGATDFQIMLAQTDMGCIAARTIQFLPGFGIARFVHLGFAIFDGVRDRLISEEIRPYIFGGIVQEADIVPIDFSYVYFSKGFQSTVPPMYFCICPLLGANGTMNRVFCYDLVLKAWTIIDLPWPVSAVTSIRTGEGKPLLLAGRSDTGVVNRIQAGDVQWDSTSVAAASVAWSLRGNDVFVEGSSQRVFYRQLTIRGQVTDPTIPPTISVHIFLDGKPTTPDPIPYFIEPQPGSNQFQLDVDILLNGQIAHVAMSGTGRLVIDSLDWEAIPKQGRKVIG